MASTAIARRCVRIQLLRFSSHLSIFTPRPERVGASANREGNVTDLSFFSSDRRVLVPSSIRFFAAVRRDLSVVRGKGERMDGEGETAHLGASDTKIEEQVVFVDKEIDQREENDVEDGKQSDDKKQEEVQSRPGVWFRLTGSCSLVLHRGDITTWHKDGKTDAIVNAANEKMLGGGGVDGAIHRAAGTGLFDACLKVPEVSKGVRCPVGSAIITPGFNLPVAHVIHTVGPMYWKQGDPASALAKAYKTSVNLAIKNGVKYIAFPAISCGVYHYPHEEAAKVSIQAIRESADQLSEVHFVLFDPSTYNAWLAEAEEKLEKLST